MILRAKALRTVTAMPLPAPVRKHALSAVTALLCAVAFWRLGLSPELPAVLAFIFGGVLLAVIDWRVRRLPRRLVYLTFTGVTAGLVFASLVEWEWKPFATALAGASLPALCACTSRSFRPCWSARWPSSCCTADLPFHPRVYGPLADTRRRCR